MALKTFIHNPCTLHLRQEYWPNLLQEPPGKGMIAENKLLDYKAGNP